MALDDYKQDFSLSYSQFIMKNNVDSSQIDENLRYEKLINVTRVNLPHSQYFYFKDGKLQIIYLSDDKMVKKLWSEFKSISGASTAEKTVRSRAGKTSNQLIFATLGITVSITQDDVHFIEMYPPCSLEYYIEHIYQEPGPFIR